jgi:hypothetical protein
MSRYSRDTLLFMSGDMILFGDSFNGWSQDRKWAVGLATVGGILLAAGALTYVMAKRQEQQNGFGRGKLPKSTSRTRIGGMTLTHHYDPDMPVEKRVALLQGLVWKGVQNPQMRHLALAITGKGTRKVKVGSQTFVVEGANCPARDGLCETQAIYDWVRENIRYSGDVAPIKLPNGNVEGVDLFQSAKRSSEFGAGDCDDHSVLSATLLSLNGIQGRFRVTAPDKNSDWQHIYTTALLPKNNPSRAVALDTTLPGNFFSREAPFAKKLDFDV